MNIDKLHTIFANYIRKFDVINQPKLEQGHDENYKWRVAAQFPDLMNPDGPDFVAGMKKVASKDFSYNLFDSQGRYPLNALIKCAKMDENAVRNLFRALFADDSGSLIMRQKKIEAFTTNANALIKKAYPDYHDIRVYENNQRSAMSFLFFHDPEHHYLYKANEAKAFANAVEFLDDWGPQTNFKMDIYYRMCDELVAEIKKSYLLLRTTKRRYYSASGEPLNDVHPDKNYHILAFDIIWGTGIDNPDYNFGNGISWMSLNEMEEIAPPTNNFQLQEDTGITTAGSKGVIPCFLLFYAEQQEPPGWIIPTALPNEGRRCFNSRLCDEAKWKRNGFGTLEYIKGNPISQSNIFLISARLYAFLIRRQILLDFAALICYNSITIAETR